MKTGDFLFTVLAIGTLVYFVWFVKTTIDMFLH